MSQYRLTLNLNKTKIVELPEPLVDSWVTKINNAVPWKKDANGNVSLNTRDAIRFLDYAVHLKRAEPDGSVLKLAAGLICSRVHGDTAATVFQYILNLSWHYPILLPLLEKIDISPERHDTLSLVEKLNSILKVNTEHRRSDGMCWALYYIKLLKEEPSQVNIERILETQDATTIALLSNFENGKADAISYANKVIETGDLYDRDRHWILLYELFFRGEINNPYPQEPAFEILKKYDVQFIYPPERRSEAENYCFYYSSPFRKPGEIRLSFQEYLDNNI